jgi:signal transduction histidine kinase
MSTTSSSAQSSLVEAAYAHFPSSVAIIDGDGVIVDVNVAWRTFGERNGGTVGADNVGENYLAACDSANDDDAHIVASGLRSLLSAERDLFTHEYECSGPDTVRWFLLQAVRFSYDESPYVLIAHLDVTDRKLGELEVWRVNERLSSLAALLSEEMSTAASLSVGRLSLLEAEIESEHIPPLRTSLKSLQDNVTELLTIIRGEVLPPSDDLDLEAVARDVWERTRTREATLEIPDTVTVRADPDRLSRMLNHLYRASLLRSPGDGVVTVRPTADGFAVEHDWPGVADSVDPRVAVGDGAWLDSDLAIAELLAAAHGWLLQSSVEDERATYNIVGVDSLP